MGAVGEEGWRWHGGLTVSCVTALRLCCAPRRDWEVAECPSSRSATREWLEVGHSWLLVQRGAAIPRMEGLLQLCS